MNNVTLRHMLIDDIKLLTTSFQFPWNTYEQTFTKWQRYFQEQHDNQRMVCIIEKDNNLLGYGTLLRQSRYLNFQEQNIPEINDVWIDQNKLRQGLATKLISFLEDFAQREGYAQVGLGVGLYSDYGPAQRLYFKLGYQPDGMGITYNYQAIIPGEKYLVDDELLLWLIKDLSN